MRILLDTHVLVWFLQGAAELTEETRAMVTDGKNDVFYSAVSVWEVSVKHALHPDNMRIGGREFSELCRASGLYMLPLTDEHVYALDTLRRDMDAPKHKDPFDRMLLSQAKTEEMMFLTHDPMFSGYHEACVRLI